MYVTGQNDHQTKILSGQLVILAGHCPLTGRYLQPWCIVERLGLKGNNGLEKLYLK